VILSRPLLKRNADYSHLQLAPHLPAGNRGNIIITGRNPRCEQDSTVGSRQLHLGELCVDDIEKINWDHSAFDTLVIPANQKDIVQSLVERHTNGSDDEKFDDIIQGKGQNVVVLLQYGSEPAWYFYSWLTFKLLAALLALERLWRRKGWQRRGSYLSTVSVTSTGCCLGLV